MSYVARIEELFEGVHADVKLLFDPTTQKRKFPKRALAALLRRKNIRELLTTSEPGEITSLVSSTDKLDLIPSEILRSFLS